MAGAAAGTGVISAARTTVPSPAPKSCTQLPPPRPDAPLHPSRTPHCAPIPPTLFLQDPPCTPAPVSSHPRRPLWSSPTLQGGAQVLPALVQVAAGAHEAADDGGDDGDEEHHGRGDARDGLGAVGPPGMSPRGRGGAGPARGLPDASAQHQFHYPAPSTSVQRPAPAPSIQSPGPNTQKQAPSTHVCSSAPRSWHLKARQWRCWRSVMRRRGSRQQYRWWHVPQQKV